jgi:hypothetical protein
MRSINTTVTVSEDGTITVNIPSDMPAGRHRAVLVIDDAATNGASRHTQNTTLEWSSYPVGLAADDVTFRREDLYDD